MRLSLDTSVLLAAYASERGASREIFHRSRAQGWRLISTPYAIDEVARNLPKFPVAASAEWVRLRPHLRIRDNVLTLDRPVVFHPARIARFFSERWPGPMCSSRWTAGTSRACSARLLWSARA